MRKPKEKKSEKKRQMMELWEELEKKVEEAEPGVNLEELMYKGVKKVEEKMQEVLVERRQQALQRRVFSPSGVSRMRGGDEAQERKARAHRDDEDGSSKV